MFSSNVDVPLCKCEIFQVSRGEEQIRRRNSVGCLFRIPCYPPFRNFLHSCVLTLGGICWLEICIRELILNRLIYLFVCKLDVAFCNARFFRFV